MKPSKKERSKPSSLRLDHLLCPVKAYCFMLGVQLDEPSSPLSKQYDGSGGDIVKPVSKEFTDITNVVNSLPPDDADSKLSRDRLAACPRSKNDFTVSAQVTLGDVITYQYGAGDRNVEIVSDKKDRLKSQDVSVTFTLEEDEGLDIRDSNSSINKGDHSNPRNTKYTSDSSNENSETEISENLESVDLSEVSVELSDLNLKDHTLGSGTDEAQRVRSKDGKKKRFRRLIRKPAIKRSQSLGCEKDLAPEHALFLQYNPEDIHSANPTSKDKMEAQRRTIYKTTSADAAMMSGEVLPLDPQDSVKSKPKSSIAKNVRRKLQKLHRRNTDSFLGAAIMSVRGSKVTQAEALEWGNSFESLLMDKNGLEMFKNFLKSEFSEENIEFWIACEEFKTTRTNKLTTRAQKIYGDFVAVNAPRQINLDSKTRLETVTNLENPTRDLFRQAQKRIQFLMENDSYKRFLETDTYKNLVGPSSPSAS